MKNVYVIMSQEEGDFLHSAGKLAFWNKISFINKRDSTRIIGILQGSYGFMPNNKGGRSFYLAKGYSIIEDYMWKEQLGFNSDAPPAPSSPAPLPVPGIEEVYDIRAAFMTNSYVPLPERKRRAAIADLAAIIKEANANETC